MMQKVRGYLLSVIAILLVITISIGYGYFASVIGNANAVINEIIVFEEKYRVSSTGNVSANINVDGLKMFQAKEDMLANEITKSINVTLQNLDNKYRVWNFDIVWVWDHRKDSYVISQEGILEYTVDSTGYNEKNLPN